MDKLRKSRPAGASNTAAMSRTMQLAVGVGDSSSATTDPRRGGTWFSAPVAAAPRTKVEQYWAARALVAETLLSARDRHQAELADVRRTEEQKRERETGVVLRANDQRQQRLERRTAVCLAVLLGCTCSLVMVLAPADRDAKGRSSKPSHFTIPILSPFASVVEHESSVFGTSAVAIFILVIGIAVYAALKHRFSQLHTR